MFNVISTIALIYVLINMCVTIGCLTYAWIKTKPFVIMFLDEKYDGCGITYYDAMSLSTFMLTRGYFTYESIHGVIPDNVLYLLWKIELEHYAKKNGF